MIDHILRHLGLLITFPLEYVTVADVELNHRFLLFSSYTSLSLSLANVAETGSPHL